MSGIIRTFLRSQNLLQMFCLKLTLLVVSLPVAPKKVSHPLIFAYHPHSVGGAPTEGSKLLFHSLMYFQNPAKDTVVAQ